MSSDDESAVNDLDVSERETQFVPRSDDDEILWEVLEITAERGKKYRVKWAGSDPATGKPWAQSWVAKHDCTDKLVREWKAKKKLNAEKKKRGRPSTKSRSSVSSKSDRTSSTKKEARPSTSKVASSSRLSSVEEQPPKKSSVKRKRQPDTPPDSPKHALSPDVSSVDKYLSPPPRKAAPKRKRQEATPAETSTNGDQADERRDSDSSRPRKKQKSMVEVLLPPLDTDEDPPLPPGAKAAPQRRKSPPKSRAALSDEEHSSPPKGKPRALLPKKPPPEDDAVPSDASAFGEPSGPLASKNSRLARETRHSELKGVARPKHKSPPAESGHLSEKEVELLASPLIKVGPPRGVKRQAKQKETGLLNKPGPSRPMSRQTNPFDHHGTAKEPQDLLNNLVPSESPMVAQDITPIAPASPLHIPMPEAPITRPLSPVLSPGTRARLELFDRMIVEMDDVPQRVEDDTVYANDDHYDPPGLPTPPPASPPRSKTPAHKPRTPNGLVVPETESSGNSQTQTQPQPIAKPPSFQIPQPCEPSLHKPVELPTIAVIAASTPPSTSSLDECELLPPPQRHPPTAVLKKSTYKPVPQISPNTFRSRVHAVDDAPPSSIESFASPKRVDKGKQKAVDVEVYSEVSGDEDDRDDHKRVARKWARGVTDSALRKRGQELSNQEQQRRETERRRQVPPKRLKHVDSIIDQPLWKASSRPFTGGDNALELSLVAGGEPHESEAEQSTTLDTQGQSVVKPMSEEDKARLRIELRREEEESTQEALGYAVPPPASAEIQNGGDIDMSPPRLSKDSSFVRPTDDVDPIEQPSADFQQASVLVQASQEPRHEDTDVEPLPTNATTSSPARPIPENLSDSPKRRLGEALSLLNVKSEEIQRLERELDDTRKTVQSLRDELTDTRRSPKPSQAAADLVAWETERHDLLKARENLDVHVAVLVKEVEKEKAERSALEGERTAWIKEREELVGKMAQQLEELAVLAKIRGEQEQHQLKLEAEWAEEKAKWELDRAAWQEKQEALSTAVDELTGKVASLTNDKVSVQKDRDFFREQYAQASGFVGSVREENLELEKRVKIAEGQAREGVAGIKALCEGRVKTLELDIDRWKGLTELLQEKDRRTNDELRSRAARALELEELCRRLTVENGSLDAELRKLGRVQRRTTTQRNKLYYEILMLKKERASLRSKISQAINLASSSTQETSAPSQPAPAAEAIEIDPNDIEILPEAVSRVSQASQDDPSLFPCMWRPELKDQCQHVFDTKEDLERHIAEHFSDLMMNP